MTNDGKNEDWQTGTWEGSRKAQLRAALRLTVRQRLEALEAMSETSRHMAQLREQGAFHYGEQNMNKDSTSPQRVAERQNQYAAPAGAARHRVHLRGCSPTPLASYLKALAIHRLVAEQKDPEARGWWEGEHFVLESALDEAELKAFFLDEFRPTPIIAPWNGGSGFYFREEKIKDLEIGKNVKTGRRNQSTTATKVIGRLLGSKTSRLHDLRKCVEASKAIINELALEEAPKGEEKNKLLNILRARLPDVGLSSLDASILIANEDLMFPPLLGTGGTDGNLDFTNNFIQRLFDLIDGQSGLPIAGAHSLLKNSLFEDVAAGFTHNAVGQFSPGQVGGPNANNSYEAKSLINPWDFIFMIEGALLFAAAATRRLGNEAPGTLAFPFTAHPKGSGQGGVSLLDEKNLARAEIWLPLWDRPATLPALKGLFSEGRITLGRRTVKDGLDFVRALALLASDRGIGSFQRYAFMKRSGKAYLATPLNRFYVPRSPRQDLISELDHWLWRVQAWARSDNASNRIRRLVQRLDNALFDMTGSDDRRSGRAQKVLILLGEIQRYAGTSPATQEKLPPLPLLSERWFQVARDNTAEFRLASALAGLQGDRGAPLPFRAHLSPVDLRHTGWLPEGARNLYRTWHHGGLEKNLLAVLEKRLLLATRMDCRDKPLGGRPGADLASISAFLAGATDDRRIGQLLGGLAHCKAPQHIEWDAAEPGVVPPAFDILKLVLTPDRQLRRCGVLAAHEHLPVPAGLVRLLAAGRIHQATRLAQRRLRIAGVPVIPVVPDSAGLSGERLAAALLIPLSDRAIRYLYRAITRLDERQVS